MSSNNISRNGIFFVTICNSGNEPSCNILTHAQFSENLFFKDEILRVLLAHFPFLKLFSDLF